MQSSRRPDLAMDPSGMRIFKRRYFNINRKLLMRLGLWPYQRKSNMYIIRIIIISMGILLSLPQLIDVILQTEDLDRQMMGFVSFMTLILMILKITGMILAEEKMREIHRSIVSNWRLIVDENERDILHTYSERARTATIIYYVGIMVATAIACTLPCIPKILDKILPLENPRPEIVLIQGEYFIDKKRHFTLFFLINFSGTMFSAFICAAVETTYVVYVEHCCALYAVVRSRLLALRRIMPKNSSATEDGDGYEWLVQTLQLHQRALTFTTLLDDSYSTVFLVQWFIGLLVFPLACCAIIAQLDNTLHLIPYAMYSTAVLIQGFVISCPGQRIIDHQLSLCDAAYCNEWYETSLRTRELLLIFMLRCSQPTILKAGGLLVMNFELYFKVCKTGASYVTVASSFR